MDETQTIHITQTQTISLILKYKEEAFLSM